MRVSTPQVAPQVAQPDAAAKDGPGPRNRRNWPGAGWSSFSGGISTGDSEEDLLTPQGLPPILRIYGSTLPRCLPYAFAAALEGGLLKGLTGWKFLDNWREGGGWYHPYTFNVLGMVLGFALVMRVRSAYQRFWEGATQCHQAAAKWGDALMQIFTFDEASKDAFSDAAYDFRLGMLHLMSLMHACALIDIRQDDLLGLRLTVNHNDPYRYVPYPERVPGHTPTASGPPSSDGSFVEGSTSPSLMRVDPGVQGAVVIPMCGDSAPSKESAPSIKHGLQRKMTPPMPNILKMQNSPKMPPMREIRGSQQPLDKLMDARLELVRAGELSCGGGVFVQSFSAVLSDNPVRSRSPSRNESEGNDSEGGSSKKSTPLYRTASNNLLLHTLDRSLERLDPSNCFDVVGGVSHIEERILKPLPPADRAYHVQSWMLRLMTARLKSGGLAIPPPLLSRTYQVLSDGNAAAMQARKVSYIAFPYPLRQLLVVLLLVFNILAPVCIASVMDSWEYVSLISFFSVLGYIALNETSRELEQPFGLGPNHLRLSKYQREFNAKLVGLLNRRVPDLGYGVDDTPAPTFGMGLRSRSSADSASGT